MSYVFPSRERAFAALIRAPLVPVALLFILDASDRVMQSGPLAIVGSAMLSFYILVVMEVASIAIGGPILALLWKKTSFNVLLTSVLGGGIALLPVLALLLLPSGNYDAWIDGERTVIEGQKTAYGQWRDLQVLALVFAFGSIGGASFWWFGRPKADEPDSRTHDR